MIQAGEVITIFTSAWSKQIQLPIPTSQIYSYFMNVVSNSLHVPNRACPGVQLVYLSPQKCPSGLS